MGKQKRTGGAGTAKALLFGILFSAALFLLSALIVAGILSVTENPTASLPLVSLGAFGCSGLLAGLILAGRQKEGGTLPAILSSLAFVLLLLLVGILMTGGHLTGRVMMNHVCYLLAASLGAFLPGMRKKKGTRRRRSSYEK